MDILSEKDIEEEEEYSEEDEEDNSEEEDDTYEVEKEDKDTDINYISHIEYQLWSEEAAFKSAVCVVSVPSYDPIFNSVNDPRMGPMDFSTPCSTCLRLFKYCHGHMGVIDLRNTPVIHPVFIRDLKEVLNSICHQCGQFLLSEEEQQWLGKITNWSNIPCRFGCGVNTESYVIRNEDLLIQKGNGRIVKCDTKDVLELLKKTPGNYKDMIITALPVIPTIFRLPVLLYGVLTPHDFSKCYSDILRSIAANDIEKITQNIKVLFDSGKNLTTSRKMLGIKQRIQAKKGTIRKTLLGKRVDFCGRTVLRPAPDIEFDQIEIPRVMRKAFTKKEMDITLENWAEVMKMVQNDDGIVVGPKYSFPLLGYKFKKYIQEGDYIVMNRQPTLHKQGIMAHRVVFGDTYTIGLHLSATSPYNADFDGDEGNLHFPQGEDAEKDLKEKMNIKNYIISDHDGETMISVVYDGVTGTYLLSHHPQIDPEEAYYITGNYYMEPVRGCDLLLPPLTGKKGVTKKDIKNAIKTMDKEEAFYFINETTRRAIRFLENHILSAPYCHILEMKGDCQGSYELFETDISGYTTENDFVSMVLSGAKGTSFHLTQLTKFLGQQYVNGQIIEVDPETGRTNPFSPFYSTDPKHKGFIKNSFLSGLSPEEMIFHSMGGREGLIDTAIKTAEIGSLQRNIAKSLEDVILRDNIVTTSTGSIISWLD